ncbi:hypothetical protein Cgig2_011306 [Carnegiea gigantea]|uniref:Uncharacterized protein n=1 Tax=Carnegiea gigantea TaxID=171969 RepID=A0A9Q1JRV2_9CARY|nr:hypothetical protein Cgig2_011306 [Carnegiea gigantea]
MQSTVGGTRRANQAFAGDTCMTRAGLHSVALMVPDDPDPVGLAVVPFPQSHTKEEWLGSDCFNEVMSIQNLRSCMFNALSHFSSMDSAKIKQSSALLPINQCSEVVNDVEAMRMRLVQALQNEDHNGGLIQSLYDAARVFELSMKEQSSLLKFSWFSAVWLRVNKFTWIKALSYQVALISSIDVDFLPVIF